MVDDNTRRYERMLAESVEWLKARGVGADGYVARGHTIDQIAAYTKRLGIDLIVLGHYPQPSGGFWWSGTQRVSLAERANCCVFVAVDNPGDQAGGGRAKN
jgi:nucleotide-binding universal stress UspA family protein